MGDIDNEGFFSKVKKPVSDGRSMYKELNPVAWINAKGDYCEISRPDTVYGSHTIPLYTEDQLDRAVNQAITEALEARLG